MFRISFDEQKYVKETYYDESGDYELPANFDFNHMNCYQLKNNKIVLDEKKLISIIEKENNQLIIQELKNELNSTDYMVIKSYEYYLAGLEIPYDFTKLHTQRQELRDKINELEKKYEIKQQCI